MTMLALLLQVATPQATATPPPNPWAPIQFMVGQWEGESEGQPGRGTVKRGYGFVLRDRFLYEQNVSTYPPQPKKEKGEIGPRERAPRLKGARDYEVVSPDEFVETFELASREGPYEVYSRTRFKRVGRP